MIPHAKAEVQALASNSAVVAGRKRAGWNTQSWDFTAADVDRMVAAYKALLLPVIDPDLDDLLADLNIAALAPPVRSEMHEQVARADAIELAAAASVIASDGLLADELFMPNVPKQSDAASERGIDVIGIHLNVQEQDRKPVVGDQLVLVSVKHSIQSTTDDLRRKLIRSVTVEFTNVYIYQQLRYLHGLLIQAHIPIHAAARVFGFMEDMWSRDDVLVVCVGAAAPDPDSDVASQVGKLETIVPVPRTFRTLTVPQIKVLHERLLK